MKNISFLAIFAAVIVFYGEHVHGAERKSTDSLVIIDKNNNTVSIGGIEADAENQENVTKETDIDGMLIINNDGKVYIRQNHSEDTKGETDENNKN